MKVQENTRSMFTDWYSEVSTMQNFHAVLQPIVL